MKKGVGGGGFWTSFSLDPATNELFIPVANPAPDFEVADTAGRKPIHRFRGLAESRHGKAELVPPNHSER